MSEPLRVAVRVRPPQPLDGRVRGPPTVEKRDNTTLAANIDGAEREFQFDRVFGQDSTQVEVFTSCTLPLVEAVLAGTNGCIFAFGQTGSGKTHSMIGPEGGRRQDGQSGVLPRAASELFRRIAQLEADAALAVGAGGFSAFEVRASFIEVYCENAFDLLGSAVSATRDAAGACPIREQTDPFRVYAEGAKEVRVTSTARLLELVARGAANRATAATGANEHSSRSHALLTLTVEHRWRDVGDPDERKFMSRLARLTLVDLAGSETMERSHGGKVDSAGVGTNLGLLVLGRVIHALANGERVPFRDSTLTRLLQTSLGGAAKTQMLACVSPAEIDAAQTFRTLQYASSARDVRVTPEVASVREEIDTDPMVGDFEDEDRALNRRAIWIETREYGDVFARCVGDPADPLILWVHGSGPCNSSMFWNEVIMDVTRLARENTMGLPKTFFHVAIDCPGYGRSPFDRQTIRSYPGQFLTAVVTALGRRSAAAMCGSSQGCASVFNAALECPRLMHALAVCHPVGHAPARFTNISQPTLLIFDVEDEGHPVSVGRQMRRYLPNNRYFEFTRSTDGNWEADHMGDELVKMLGANWEQIKGKRRGGRPDPKLPELMRVAGGFRAWSEVHGAEHPPMSGDRGWGADDTEAEASADADDENVWRAILNPSCNLVEYMNVKTGRVVKFRPSGARILVEGLDHGAPADGAKAKPTAAKRRRSAAALFEEEEEESEDEDARLEREERERLEAADDAEREASQRDCDLCGGPLFAEATRLVACRCALCKCCVEQTVRYTRHCPVCSKRIEVKKGVPVSDAKELNIRLRAREAEATGEAKQMFEEQRARAKTISDRSAASCRITLEFGNTAKAAGSKTSYVSFVKPTKTEHLPKDISSAVAKVDFNINPGYSKPTASVKDPDAKTGALFEYAMARSYPNVITVHFHKDLGLPQLIIRYYVQDEKSTSRRIIIEVPRAGLKRRRGGQVEFHADPPRSGWVRFADGGSHEVQYLAEGEAGRTPLPHFLRRPSASSVRASPEKWGPPSLRREKSNELRRRLDAADDSGAMSLVQLSKLLPDASEQDIKTMFDAIGPAANGTVDFAKLCDFVYDADECGAAARCAPEQPQPGLRRERSNEMKQRLLDVDGMEDGLISSTQIASLVPQLSPEEIAMVMDAMGAEGEVDVSKLCDFIYDAAR